MSDTIDDRYRVLRLLGEGAAARTLLVERVTDGRRLALKELRSEHLEDWKQYELFEREARVLAALDHPGVPEVAESFQAAGVDGQRRLYLAQEWVEGASLAERVERGPRLGREGLTKVALGVLEVLEYLHSRTPPVFHRDIKPSNIMVREDLSVVLIDFGGVCDAWRQQETGSTVIATHGYTAPEQYLGIVSATCDLYSVGATLLNAATGRSPSDFVSADTGRVEVDTDELPVSEAMQRVIASLLHPEPQARMTVAAARALLDGSAAAAPGRELAVAEGRGMAVTPEPRRSLPIANAPVFVDLGDPPRDPEGPLGDVYRVLVPRMLDVTAGRTLATKLALIAVLTVATAGFILPIGWLISRSRRKRFEPLFRHGLFTVGRLTQVGGTQTLFHYEYEVGGQLHRGSLHYSPQQVPCVAHFAPGDEVAVLFDAAEPGTSCFMFRPPGAWG